MSAAGSVCADYHDRKVRKLDGFHRIEIDEIWAFVYAKDYKLRHNLVKNAPPVSGSAWTFTALDADTKLIISYLVAERNEFGAGLFVQDLCSRLTRPPQITADGFIPYKAAVEDAFGAYSNFSQVIKSFESDKMKEKYKSEDVDNIENLGEYEGRKYKHFPKRETKIEKRIVAGNPDMDMATTSHVERNNLNIRMFNRRFTRLTNAFSKRIDKLIDSINLHFLYSNFCRIHGSLRVTPAMEAGLTDTVHDLEWLVGMIDDSTTPPKRPKHYKKKKKAREQVSI